MPSIPPQVSCPSPEALSRFARKQIDPQTAAQIQSHLQICAPCRRVVDESRAKLRSEFATEDTPVRPHPGSGASTVSLAGSTDIREPVRANSSALTTSSLERYRIGAEIARGGMGVVHRATDLLFKREVAIKLLHPKLQHNPQALEAFRYEAEITARLQHPGIPPIHDLGTLPDGRPFLAMKLIQGKTLHELLKARESLSDDLPRWLQIFEQIAQAVGYAHSQNIIHRDLKPLNVMVGEFGEVQVMDWGLAKVVGEKERPGFASVLVEREFATLPGDIKGTLQYMPPEQARGEIDRLDSRADVFGLGAILCEILTGEPPYSRDSVAELRRKVAAADTQVAVERIRATEADPEIIELAIACLAADSENRLPNSTAIAEAIATHRASVEQRLRRAETERALSEQRLVEQTRRRRLWYGIAAASGLFALACGSLAVVYAQSNSIIADRESKATSAALLAAQREKVAIEESAISAATTDFLLSDLLSFASPEDQADAGLKVDPDLKVRDLVKRAAGQIAGRFPDQPLVEARIRRTIGYALSRTGEFELAVQQDTVALKLFTQELGPEHAETLRMMTNLGIAYHNCGQLELALPYLEKSHQIRQQTGQLNSRQALEGANALAAVLRDLHDFARSEQIYNELLEVHLNSSDELDSGFLNVLNNLAGIYSDTGDFAKSLQLTEETYKRAVKRFGSDHPKTLVYLANLGCMHREKGDLEGAMSLLERAYVLQREKLGIDHPDTLHTAFDLAVTRRLNGEHEVALELLNDTMHRLDETLGAAHPKTLKTKSALAIAYNELGRPDDALPLFAEVVEQRKQRLGESSPDTVGAVSNLAAVYHATGRVGEAIGLFENCLRVQREKLGPEHPETLKAMGNLALACNAADQRDRAIALLEDAHKVQLRKLGREHPETLLTASNLATVYRDAGKLQESIALLEECYEIHNRLRGDSPHQAVIILNNLATSLRQYGDLEKATALLESALKSFRRRLGDDHPDTLTVLNSLALVIRIHRTLGDAIPLFEEAIEKRRAKLGDDHPDTLQSIFDLATTLHDFRDYRRAQTLYEECLERRRKRFGDNHPDTLDVTVTLGITYLKNGNVTAAIDILEPAAAPAASRALAARFEPLVLPNALSEAYFRAGRFADAIPHQERSAAVLREQFGKTSAKYLLALYVLASLETKARDFERAEIHLKAGFNAAQTPGDSAVEALSVQFAKGLANLYQAWDKPALANEWRQVVELSLPKPE